jgi:uncharacterized membrane protein
LPKAKKPEAAPTGSWLQRHLVHNSRFYIAATTAIAVFFIIPGGFGREARILAGADAFFAVYLVQLVVFAWNSTPDSTKRHATAEDDGIVLIASLTAAAACLSVWAIIELILAKDDPSAVGIGLAIAAVPLGWAFVHANFAPHYARLYYYRDKQGGAEHFGLDFPGPDEPDVWDFLYFSFVIGTAAQTSDVQIVSRAIRRLALAHGVVSFFYNTVIVALAVNGAVQLAG